MNDNIETAEIDSASIIVEAEKETEEDNDDYSIYENDFLADGGTESEISELKDLLTELTISVSSTEEKLDDVIKEIALIKEMLKAK